MKTKYEASKEVDKRADELVEIFNAPDSRRYFCKCVWYLRRDQIDYAIEESKGSLKLFIFLCEKMMGK